MTREDIKTLAQVWSEMNTIRARDGVPYTCHGYKSGICEIYFSSLIDKLNDLVEKESGHSAHCHPYLYSEKSE